MPGRASETCAFTAEQPILERFAKTGVHRQRDDQRRDAGGHAENGKCGDQPQHRRPIGRPQIAARNKPFKFHEWSERASFHRERIACVTQEYVTHHALRKRSLRLALRAAAAETG